MLHSINHEQRLYNLKSGNGFSCHGFDVVEKLITRLCLELGLERGTIEIGTKEHYELYQQLVDVARRKHVETGWRSQAELNRKLIGLEGKRVEVVYTWGEKERFYVGRSTGWIPCHLAIKRRDSHGGGAVLSEENMVSVTVVGSR